MALSPPMRARSVPVSNSSREALEVARLGRYGSWSFRAGPPQDTAEVHPVGGQWEVGPRLKTMAIFHELNLAREPLTGPPGAPSVDVIFCRNVLLYFLPDSAARILS